MLDLIHIEAIEVSDVVAADISRLTFNVTFELGYPIGRKSGTPMTPASCVAAPSCRPVFWRLQNLQTGRPPDPYFQLVIACWI